MRIETDERGCPVLVYADGYREAFYDFLDVVVILDPAKRGIRPEPEITLVWEEKK
jgi:hypothetical protein